MTTMTTYAFSTLADQQTIAFDPNADVLNFDNAFASAGAYRLVSASSGTNIVFRFGAKTVFLTPSVSMAQLTTGNIVFSNGSVLLVGDNTTGTIADNIANILTGTSKDDLLIGLAGNDSINAGAGNDRIFMSALAGGDGGFDTVDGGAGFDRVSYEGSSAINVNLQTGIVLQATGGTDLLLNVEGVIGTDFADFLLGGNPNLPITGAATDSGVEFEGHGGNLWSPAAVASGTGDTSDPFARGSAIISFPLGS